MPYIVSQKREQPNLGGFPAHVATVAAAGDLAAKVPVEERLLSIEDFYRLGEPIVTECIDSGAPCSIAIVDIDRLFRISETHGTECADAVLAEFGTNLMHMASHRNMSVAHLGFDQFALLLAGQDGAEATESFDQLRLELGARAIGWKGEMISLTVSIGLADIHGPETFDNYLNAAEQFLFMAKMSGRNQVVSDHSFGAAH
jgi:diguanylate cyclase (GGDEF)-like protein